MTLSQYYEQHAKKMGHQSWNHLCAVLDLQTIRELKQVLKSDYKASKGQK